MKSFQTKSNSQTRKAVTQKNSARVDEGDDVEKEGISYIGNWKYALMGCGSNAFNQVSGSSDLMISSLVLIDGFHLEFDNTEQPAFDIESVTCGSAFSTAIITPSSSSPESMGKSLYTWGYAPAGLHPRFPSLFSLKNISVRQVSCGVQHAGFVSTDGRVYTWGSGENGMLGHGTRTSATGPKLVAALSKLHCLFISCGAYHSAVIAAPPSTTSGSSSSHSYVVNLRPFKAAAFRIADSDSSSPLGREAHFQAGDLYTFGLGKAGQLGLGAALPKHGMIVNPTLVTYLSSQGFRVSKVVCGLNHTVVMALIRSSELNNNKAASPLLLSARGDFNFNTTSCNRQDDLVSVVLTCGWGENGRLGLGDDKQRYEPSLVHFPDPAGQHLGKGIGRVNIIDIAAGDVHCLAVGVAYSDEYGQQSQQQRSSCYSWGSNEMSQLGVGSPAGIPEAMSPAIVPLPSGIEVSSVSAGGRHSAAITTCGKLLTWGWGEEGQLGHGSEKNSHFARPCKFPRVAGKTVTAAYVSAGASHTLVLVKNTEHILFSRPAAASEVETVEISIRAEPDQHSVFEMKKDDVEKIEKDEQVVMLPVAPVVKPAILSVSPPRPLPNDENPSRTPSLSLQGSPKSSDSEQEPEAVRNIRGLLSHRSFFATCPGSPISSPSKEGSATIGPRPLKPESEAIDIDISSPPLAAAALKLIEETAEEVLLEADVQGETTNPPLEPKPTATTVYYKRDQEINDKLLVANTARRAEIRKRKKLEQQQKKN